MYQRLMETQTGMNFRGDVLNIYKNHFCRLMNAHEVNGTTRTERQVP